MYKTSLLLIALIVTFSSCQQTSHDTGESTTEVLLENQAYTAHLDSLEDAADKMRDASGGIESSLVVKFDGGWLADKELNTIRRITLENRTNKKIVGVKLAYRTGTSKEFDNRNVGKFKVVIKPHEKLLCKFQRSALVFQMM
jgi:hypothetical protein